MLSIIVSWRDRAELIDAAPNLCRAAAAVGGEVVVVNFGGDPDDAWAQLPMDIAQVRMVSVEAEDYFNKSRAQNIGASVAAGSVLFFCDCDIVVDPSEIVELACDISREEQAFATLKGVRETRANARNAGHVICFGYELLIRTADGRSLCIVDNEEDALDGTRQAPGLLLVRRHSFEAVNGYNGRLHGWGWEDQDMISRLTLGAGLRRVSRGTALHLSHDDAARTRHYPLQNRWESRDRMFRQALSNYDKADFTGTYNEDIETYCGRMTERTRSLGN